MGAHKFSFQYNTLLSNNSQESHKILQRSNPHAFSTFSVNDRIGRLLIYFQPIQFGLPRLIFRNSEKEHYCQAFGDYRNHQTTRTIESILSLALLESVHKWVTCLRGEPVVRLSDYIRKRGLSAPAATNAARR